MPRSSVAVADRRTTRSGGADDRRVAGGHGRAAGETVAVVGGGVAAREAAHLLRDESLGVVEIPALDGDRGGETRGEGGSAVEPLVGASVVVLEAAGEEGAHGAAEAQLEVLSRISPEAAAIVLAPPGAALPDYDRLGPHRPRVVSAPVTRESLLSALDAALSYRNLLRENRTLRSELRTHTRLTDWVGSSPASAAIRGAIVTAAFAETPVLFLGEPGSGLRLAAELVHRLSRRGSQPFLALDAPSLPAGELGLFFSGLRRAAGAELGGGRSEHRAGAPGGDSAAGPPGSVYLGGISTLGATDQAALEEGCGGRRPSGCSSRRTRGSADWRGRDGSRRACCGSWRRSPSASRRCASGGRMSPNSRSTSSPRSAGRRGSGRSGSPRRRCGPTAPTAGRGTPRS